MKSLFYSEVTGVWLLLTLLTGISWYLSGGSTPDNAGSYSYVTVGLFVLAFYKVRLVIMYFMEIATAPLPLRALFETWVLAVCGVVVTLYVRGQGGL